MAFVARPGRLELSIEAEYDACVDPANSNRASISHIKVDGCFLRHVRLVEGINGQVSAFVSHFACGRVAAQAVEKSLDWISANYWNRFRCRRRWGISARSGCSLG